MRITPRELHQISEIGAPAESRRLLRLMQKEGEGMTHTVHLSEVEL